jgi:hypothetical protein
MKRSLFSAILAVACVAGGLYGGQAEAAPGIHISTSTHPVVTQTGRFVHVTLRIAASRAQGRVDVTDNLPSGVRKVRRGAASSTVRPRRSAPGTLEWNIRNLTPGIPVYIHWRGLVTGRPLAAPNVVHAHSASAAARDRSVIFFAKPGPVTYPGDPSKQHTTVHMHRAGSSSPFFVRWDTHDGATFASSTTSFDRGRKARVTESFNPEGPRVRVHLRVVNLRNSQRLRVDGRLIQRTLRTPSGRRIAWLRSAAIHTVLKPHQAVGASFVYRMPSGDYKVTGGFRPF